MPNPIKKLFKGKESKAKELSKTNFNPLRNAANYNEVKKRQGEKLNVATIKTKGSPKVIAKQIEPSAETRYGVYSIYNNTPRVKQIPTQGQKVVKRTEYNNGQRVEKAKQGYNIIGQPVTKVKYNDGSKVKSTLTSKGIITKEKDMQAGTKVTRLPDGGLKNGKFLKKK
jgi:hypothetical protein